MSDERKEKDPRNSETSKPDAGTTHTTDPQQNMEGPVSSSMKEMGEAFDTNENKSEADKHRNKNM